jgi:hypothetical protein
MMSFIEDFFAAWLALRYRLDATSLGYWRAWLELTRPGRGLPVPRRGRFAARFYWRALVNAHLFPARRDVWPWPIGPCASSTDDRPDAPLALPAFNLTRRNWTTIGLPGAARVRSSIRAAWSRPGRPARAGRSTRGSNSTSADTARPKRRVRQALHENLPAAVITEWKRTACA